MQPGIKSKGFLELQGVGARSATCQKNEVPAMRRDRAPNCDEPVTSKQVVSEGLLSRAGMPGRSQLGLGTLAGSTTWT
jgi:hypothetical protein